MDRNAFILARRYAQAFLHDFHDKISLDECTRLEEFSTTLATIHSSLTLLQFMDLSLEKKTDLLYAYFKKNGLSLDAYKKLISLLLAQKRIMLLASIMHSMVMLYKERNNISSFIFTSSSPLTKDQEENIIHFLQRLTDTTVTHISVTDQSLIAGIRLQSSTLLWEDSLRNRLRSLALVANR